MSTSLVFTLCNTLVLPQWLLMIVAPKWKWTKKLINSYIIPVLLAVVYGTYAVITLPNAEGGFDSLENVMKLFTSPEAVLVGWIHYLAFDLLVGSWVLLTAQKKGIHHGFVIPCLIGCFMLGPVGFLLFWVLCRLYK